MKKDIRVQALTGAVIVVMLAVVVTQRAGWRLQDITSLRLSTLRRPPTGQDPQETIYAMLNAARAGDVKRYLSTYTGQMRLTLRQSLAESTEPEFANYLRTANAAVKGVAVFDPQGIGDGEVKVRVEYVYQDHNEAQYLYLERVGDGWKISRSDADQRTQVPVAYGTRVR